MGLYVLGDLHLSLGEKSKPMDIFKGWENHLELLRTGWTETVSEDDTVVLAGDLSWAMNLEGAREDFSFINNLPGRKIILKGNHDYWWTTLRKMQLFFAENGFDSLHILHNNHYSYGKYGICGTRGWVSVSGETEDAKILNREVIRLETSLKSAAEAGLEQIAFLHYPVIFGSNCNWDLLDVLHKYGIKQCFYGHIHGAGGFRNAVNGERDGMEHSLISCDYLHFIPKKVL